MTSQPVTRLVDAEQIRALKARYCRLLDRKDWAGWWSVFTDDCVLEWLGEGGAVEPVGGAYRVMAFLREKIRDRRTYHLCANPEIEFTGQDTAVAVWAAMFVHAGGVRRGYGHYHDRYRRVAGRWLIERYRYEPLWVEVGDPVDVRVVGGAVSPTTWAGAQPTGTEEPSGR